MTNDFDTSGLPEMYYTVTVRRTELIAFELKARSPADARERYLSDGDEVGSRLIDHTIVDVAGSPRNLEHTDGTKP